MTLNCNETPKEDEPTEVFLPEFHFPRESAQVETSSGKWSINVDEADHGMGLMQRLRWWHGTGEQKLTVRGVKRRAGVAMGKEEEEGYLDQCQQQTNKCSLM